MTIVASTLLSPQVRRRINSISRWLALISLALSTVPFSLAQRSGSPRFSGGVGHFRGDRGVFLGDPFWYSDYPRQSLAYPSPSPTVVVVPSPAAAPEPRPETKSEPLMIEWQGDHYARFGGPAKNANAPIKAKPASLPPAVLVYRDGHREQVFDYAIVGGVMYARGNFYRDGYWTKTVKISALDVPATMSANEGSSVKFVLPAGPNEVVTRP